MSALNRAFGTLWRTLALRRTSPPLETSKDRIVWAGGRIAGVYMTAEEALRLSAVWACVTVIAKSLASCKWDVFLEQRNGDRTMRRDTITYRLLNERPNPEMTSFAFREAALIQALIYGNFYAEIEPSVGGLPAGLWPLMPDRCCLERDGSGDLVLRVTNDRGGEVHLPYSDVFHLHGPGLDGLTGFDVVNVAARSFAHAAAAERFGQAFYGNGTQMGGVLASDQILQNEKIEEYREQINALHQGPDRAFRFLFLGGGMKYTPLSVAPNDAQFIETQQHLIESVCRWFGVPPHKIAHLLRSTNNNIEHQGIEFVRDALTPWAERLAQEADWKLLPDWRGIKTRLDLDWLSEGDMISKATADSIWANAGIRTRNEVRKNRGWNTSPDENADKLTVQLAMTTLDRIGQDPPDEDLPATDPAAFALFRHAAMKALNRRTRMAEQYLEAGDAGRLRDAVENDNREQARYLGKLVGDSLAALGIQGEPAGIREALTAFIEEDAALMSAAFDNETQTLGQWCVIEQRAMALAMRLASLIER
jgi:HK97 family phage portal protein